MKRYKKILVLVAVLIAVCAATVAALKIEEKQEQIQNSEEVILSLEAGTVTGISWEYEDTALAFHREEAGPWRWDEDDAFPVDEETMNEMLDLVSSFSVSFIIEDVEDYSQYGLDEPTCTIHLETAEQSYDVTLGNYSKLDQQRYVSIGDGNVFLVSTDPFDYFGVALSDMIDHSDLPDFAQATAISFTGDTEYSIYYEEESAKSYCAEDVYFTDQDNVARPLDTELVDSYLDTISDLYLVDYKTYNATEEELEVYGLAQPDLTITVDYTESEESEGEEEEPIVTEHTFTLHVGKVVTEAEEEGEEDIVTGYVRVGDSPILYQLVDSDYEALIAAAYDDLRHKEVLTADFAEDVTAIDVTLEDVDYHFTTGVNEEEEPIWLYDEEEIVITDIQSALETLSAESFTTEEPDQQEELRLTIHLNNENFPQVEIVLYRYDGTSCLVTIDGEPVSLVPRTDAVELMEAIRAIVLN